MELVAWSSAWLIHATCKSRHTQQAGRQLVTQHIAPVHRSACSAVLEGLRVCIDKTRHPSPQVYPPLFNPHANCHAAICIALICFVLAIQAFCQSVGKCEACAAPTAMVFPLSAGTDLNAIVQFACLRLHLRIIRLGQQFDPLFTLNRSSWGGGNLDISHDG